MRVLVLNCGSSSVKFAVIDTATHEAISSGLVENIGVNGHIKAQGPTSKIDTMIDAPTHVEAIAAMHDFLKTEKLLSIRFTKLICIIFANCCENLSGSIFFPL